MTIKEFYGSPFWKKQRKCRLLMDNYRCSRCGGVAQDVHHKITLTETNVNDLETSSLENLESICRKCHNRETHGTKEEYRFDNNGDPILK